MIVLYGDADGRVGEGSRGVVSQGGGTVGGVAETDDRFGSALAVADLDCDGFTDLVVGTPLEDINGQADSGYVQIIWGNVSGLGNGAKNSTQFTQNDFPNADVTAGDQFGYALDALEDVGQGGTPAPDAYALAIGVPGGDIGRSEQLRLGRDAARSGRRQRRHRDQSELDRRARLGGGRGPVRCRCLDLPAAEHRRQREHHRSTWWSACPTRTSARSPTPARSR